MEKVDHGWTDSMYPSILNRVMREMGFLLLNDGY